MHQLRFAILYSSVSMGQAWCKNPCPSGAALKQHHRTGIILFTQLSSCFMRLVFICFQFSDVSQLTCKWTERSLKNASLRSLTKCYAARRQMSLNGGTFSPYSNVAISAEQIEKHHRK